MIHERNSNPTYSGSGYTQARFFFFFFLLRKDFISKRRQEIHKKREERGERDIARIQKGALSLIRNGAKVPCSAACAGLYRSIYLVNSPFVDVAFFLHLFTNINDIQGNIYA